MQTIISNSSARTEELGADFAKRLKGGDVVALFGGLGAGKTTFVRGIAAGLGNAHPVSSPTFSIAHEYGGDPPLVHFDMYRISGWDDLYSTGFFDYLDSGAIIVTEWSENVEEALPDGYYYVRLKRIDDNSRKISIRKHRPKGTD